MADAAGKNEGGKGQAEMKKQKKAEARAVYDFMMSMASEFNASEVQPLRDMDHLAPHFNGAANLIKRSVHQQVTEEFVDTGEVAALVHYSDALAMNGMLFGFWLGREFERRQQAMSLEKSLGL